MLNDNGDTYLIKISNFCGNVKDYEELFKSGCLVSYKLFYFSAILNNDIFNVKFQIVG